MINSFAKSHYLQTATLKRTKRATENMYLALLIQGGLRTIGTEEHLRLLKVGRVQMRDLGKCKKKTKANSAIMWSDLPFLMRTAPSGSLTFVTPIAERNVLVLLCLQLLTPPASFPKLLQTITWAHTFSLSCHYGRKAQHFIERAKLKQLEI